MFRIIWDKAKTNDKLLLLLSFIYNLIGLNQRKVIGSNNIINNSKAFIKKTKFIIKGNNNKIIIEDGVRISNTVFMINGNNHLIYIGNYSVISNMNFFTEDQFCEVCIGIKTELNGGHFAVTEPNSKLLIGSNCLFSSDIEIRTGDSHSIIDIQTNKRINFAKDVCIGDHVWIGAHAKILKGVTIANNVVIGNSAIVTKSISVPNTIVGGFPAKIIKENITWKNERVYE